MVPCDQIIAAIGQRVSAKEIVDGTALDLTQGKTVAIDRATGRTSVPWIFAGGDAVTGAASVVEMPSRYRLFATRCRSSALSGGGTILMRWKRAGPKALRCDRQSGACGATMVKQLALKGVSDADIDNRFLSRDRP